MKILTLSVNGLPSTLNKDEAKYRQFNELVKNRKPDILCLVDTKINYQYGQDNTNISEIPDYKLVAWRPGLHIGRAQGTSSGGIAIYRRDNLESVCRWEERGCFCECRWCDHNRYFQTVMFNFNDETFKLCVLHISPDTTSYRVATRIMSKLIIAGPPPKNIIFVGHFNWGTNSHRYDQFKDFLGKEKDIVTLNDLSTTPKKGDLALVHRKRSVGYECEVLDIEHFDRSPILVTIKNYRGHSTTTNINQEKASARKYLRKKCGQQIWKLTSEFIEDIDQIRGSMGIDSVEESTQGDADDGEETGNVTLGQTITKLKSVMLQVVELALGPKPDEAEHDEFQEYAETSQADEEE